tara:strand:- start:193 stop:498 length:306 start_codon:yes stop_codon:yes gene_type:complete
MEHRSNIINPKTNMPYGEQTDSLAGVPLTLKQFPALQDAEVQVLRLTAERSLMDGHHPQTGVAFPLQAMCQIVVLIDDLKSQISDLEDELESYRDSRTGEE